jgi:sensor histidine kinase YesM
MGDRLRVELVLPAELGPLAVPTLLLQPLVENAIKHGLEPQTSGGLLRVNAQRAGDTLLLQVQDTGTGLPAALDAQHAPTASAGTHFGLEQVKRRLRTLYGDAAELQLAGTPGNAGGCIASVRIPWSQTQ